MKLHLIETYVNVTTDADKHHYANVVWPMLVQSYSKIGGFKSASNPADLIQKTGMWKLVRRDNKIVAGMLYKDSYGRKAIAAFSNGTPSGKSDLVKIIQADMGLDRAWGEVSGKMEELFTKFGGKPIPNQFAAVLTGKHIDDLDPDGFHYIRIINGTPVRKIIIGKPQRSM